MKKELKNSTIFNRAAKLIMERGLNKGTFGPKQGPYCALGAIYKAATGNPDAWAYNGCHPAADRLDSLFREGHPSPFWFTVDWNDLPDTTPDEVVQVLQFMALAEKDAGR